MSKYIETDALMEDIGSLYRDEDDRTDYNVAIADALVVIDEQPTADVPQWIPCSERLPEGDEIVLVNTLPIAPYQIILATAKDVRKYYTEGAVDAWMPLPEPWKGE